MSTRSFKFLTVFNMLIISALCQNKDSFFMCPTSSCSTSSLAACDHWAAILYDGQRTCACCRSDGEARLVAGTNVGKGIGLFYGNKFKVCETVAYAQSECQFKSARDCNYMSLFFRGEYVGCSYCRPTCTSNLDCAELGGICSANRNRFQPMKSCFYGSLPSLDEGHRFRPPEGIVDDVDESLRSGLSGSQSQRHHRNQAPLQRRPSG